MDDKTFGERIRALRIARGESQPDVARSVKCTPQLVSHYETETKNHANPRLSTIKAFARHFGVTPAFLIGDAN